MAAMAAGMGRPALRIASATAKARPPPEPSPASTTPEGGNARGQQAAIGVNAVAHRRRIDAFGRQAIAHRKSRGLAGFRQAAGQGAMAFGRAGDKAAAMEIENNPSRRGLGVARSIRREWARAGPG